MLRLFNLRTFAALGAVVSSAYSGYKLYQKLKKLDKEKNLKARLRSFLKKSAESDTLGEKKSTRFHELYTKLFRRTP